MLNQNQFVFQPTARPTTRPFSTFNNAPAFNQQQQPDDNQGPFEYIYYYEYEYDDDDFGLDQTTAPNRPSFNRFNEEPRQQVAPAPPRTTTPAPFRRPPPPPSPPRRPPPPPATRPPAPRPQTRPPPRQPVQPARPPPQPTRAPARGSPTARGTTEANRRPDPSQVETRLPNFSFFPVRDQLGGNGGSANNNDFPSPARPSPQIPERLVPNEPAVENNRPRARLPPQSEPGPPSRPRQPEVQAAPQRPRQPEVQVNPQRPRQPEVQVAPQRPRQPEAPQQQRPRQQEPETSPFTAFRNFPQFPRTPAPQREQSLPNNQFAPQDNNPRFVEERPRQQQPQQQPERRPEPRPEPQPAARPEPIQTIFGNQNNQQSFTLGPPFTAFNNFPQPQQQQQPQQPFRQQQSLIPQQQQFQNPPPPQQQQFQQQPQPGRSTGLGFEGVRNTVVHDTTGGSQSSSFFSFQRPEFSRQVEPSPTRFPAAQRPSPVNNGAFFGGFPNLGQFVDPRSQSGQGSQRAQRALPEDAQETVDRQSPPSYQFPEAEFGGFVPMQKRY